MTTARKTVSSNKSATPAKGIKTARTTNGVGMLEEVRRERGVTHCEPEPEPFQRDSAGTALDVTNTEISALEEKLHSLFDAISPFLEQTEPSAADPVQIVSDSNAPAVTAMFKVATRVRNLADAVDAIRARVSI